MTNIEAISPRQHHVEDEQVEASVQGHLQPAFAVARRLDDVAGRFEQIANDEDNGGLVFHQEDARFHEG